MNKGIWQRKSYDLGRYAEALVITLLLVQSHAIVRYRHLTCRGEIDIISAHDNTLYFIEVKMRKDALALHESITLKKRDTVFQVAELFLAENPQFHNFDYQFKGYLVSHSSIEVIDLY